MKEMRKRFKHIKRLFFKICLQRKRSPSNEYSGNIKKLPAVGNARGSLSLRGNEDPFKLLHCNLKLAT